MRALEAIPVRVLSFEEPLTGQAEAVLAEIAQLLERFCETGEEGSIDLRGLPLSPADKAWLDEQLGRGEVEIVLDAGGRSLLTETACSGVWKVVHRDAEERVVAELIEVAPVPGIVKAAGADVQRACDRLKSRLKRMVPQGEADE